MTDDRIAVEITPQENQMIDILRGSTDTTEFRLVIERRDGAWDIDMSARGMVGLPSSKECGARGVGATFDAAWDNMNPLWS
jgi:hypothetical protein